MKARGGIVLGAVLASWALAAGRAAGQAEALARTYTGAVRQVNEGHARKPGKTREEELGRSLPRGAKAALEKLLAAQDSAAVRDALLACGEAALDLDLMEDFQRVRERLAAISPEHARRLGTALSRPRFLLRGSGDLGPSYLEEFAAVLDAILDAYDQVFGFEEWSKVPGKKLRVRLRLVEKIEKPPHFAPEFPFHSEVDFPVADASGFKSPTADGKFLFYGLCHELGHVIAMWGNANNEEDHHAWAHYTGVAIVEHLSGKAKDLPALRNLRDEKWRSLRGERERLAGRAPSLAEEDGVLALFIALHDKVGPRAIGDAINLLDRQNRALRINRVRYYGFKGFREALLASLKDAEARKAAAAIFPAGLKN